MFYSPGEHVTQLITPTGEHAFGRPLGSQEVALRCTTRPRPVTRPPRCATMGSMSPRTAPRRGGKLSYGWHWQAEGKVWRQVATPSEQRVRGAILSLRAEGRSYAEIADMLNACDYRTGLGGAWYAMSVQRIITRNVTPYAAAALAECDPAEIDSTNLVTELKKGHSGESEKVTQVH